METPEENDPVEKKQELLEQDGPRLWGLVIDAGTTCWPLPHAEAPVDFNVRKLPVTRLFQNKKTALCRSLRSTVSTVCDRSCSERGGVDGAFKGSKARGKRGIARRPVRVDYMCPSAVGQPSPHGHFAGLALETVAKSAV